MSQQNKDYQIKKVVPVKKNGYILELQINDGLSNIEPVPEASQAPPNPPNNDYPDDGGNDKLAAFRNLFKR
jgi:hypothetical protein